MDLSRPFSISVDYQDRKAVPSWELRIFAEVALIDKTHDTLNPVVYQLKDTMLPMQNGSLDLGTTLHKLPRDAFVCLGQAVIVDKQNKQIVLDTKNIVSYNYLIIVSGSKSSHSHHEEEFSGGVQTLVGALRVKKKIPGSLASSLNKRYNSEKPFIKNASGPRHPSIRGVSKPVPPHLAPMTAKKLGIDLALLNKRLYEVLL